MNLTKNRENTETLLTASQAIDNNNSHLQLDSKGLLMVPLSHFQAGDRGKVLGFNKGERAYRHKLLAMGLTPGTEFIVMRVAPLADPVQIQVRGFALSLRKHEANALKIERV